MNTLKGRTNFKSFRILLDSLFSFTILMRKITEKLNPKRDAVTKWHKQAGIITTNIKVKIYLNLHGIIVTKIVTWNFHVDNSAKGRNGIILGRNL